MVAHPREHLHFSDGGFRPSAPDQAMYRGQALAELLRVDGAHRGAGAPEREGPAAAQGGGG